MQFYILEDLSFISEFAYGEQVEPINLGEADRCPVCGQFFSMMKWLPPHRVVLEKPKYSDLVFGSFSGMLVSEAFKESYEKANLKGISKFWPVEVVKVRRMRPDSPKPPQYYKIELPITETLLDEEVSKMVKERATCSYCRGGHITYYEGVIIDEKTWTGEDIFYAKGFPGTMIVTERFVEWFNNNNFTNGKFTLAEKYQASWIRSEF